ncbi:MAG: hypothetical protein KDB00_03545 [Planctomycetales bacterium]|nr:hypothetical protein [Planctomycetales bacterium]
MNSNLKHGLLGIALTAVATVALSNTATAQFPFPEIAAPDPVVEKPANDLVEIDRPQLVDQIPSSSDLSAGQPSAASLRQSRAQYRSQQRIERLERNLWAGYEPLRPNWNSIPMMSSRYPYRSGIFVPLYVFPR